MEVSFLKNHHHNLFENKPLLFKKYICKDCTQKKKEYEYDNSENVPKDILNLGYIEISLGKFPIYVTTPTMVCPFGFNKSNNQMTLQFTNVKDDSEMNSFFRFIQELEMKQMEYLGINDDDVDLYISQIRYDKKGRYDPNLLVKIPFRSNKYEVEVRNRDTSCSIANIYNFSKMRCDIYIDKIWKFNGKYVCKWKVKKIMIQ
ncbi:MAG: hypothetical protein CL470_06840 [Acidimicrobiaceae bacterium]|nr:hypothetical protein [Acidimicrobiaceae bacterium]|tara:strand:- start:25 stop:630 length:606 start_codon:yes stop_codon:yes gene_type:complete